MAKAKTAKKATKVAKTVEAETTKNKGQLVPNIKITPHTFKNGTTILNISCKLPDFIDFLQNNKVVGKDGSSWVNMKGLPSSSGGYTVILNDYFHDAQQLADEVFGADELDVQVEDFELESRKQENKVS
jgi:hypothetical protein|tara:strand:+ start:1919 stop:2305 length:387 start_codon:yes stop_codon:yes gene_type:complete